MKRGKFKVRRKIEVNIDDVPTGDLFYCQLNKRTCVAQTRGRRTRNYGKVSGSAPNGFNLILARQACLNIRAFN